MTALSPRSGCFGWLVFGSSTFLLLSGGACVFTGSDTLTGSLGVIGLILALSGIVSFSIAELIARKATDLGNWKLGTFLVMVALCAPLMFVNWNHDLWLFLPFGLVTFTIFFLLAAVPPESKP